MEWGIAINLRESVSEIIEKAVVADMGGIHTVWLTDFPATRFSPALASIVAENTKHCRIGVGLLSPLIYSPSHIVQMMSTLIDTYEMDIDLLLGPGDRMKLGEIGVSYGPISTLVERMTESVIKIREGLSEYKNCRIFMGAQGPKMIEASTCADGVLLNYSDPEMIQWAITRLQNKPENFYIGVFPPSLIGISNPCEEQMSIKTSAAIVALGLSSSIVKKFGLRDRLQPAIDKMKIEGLTDEIVAMMDQEILGRFSLCGSIDLNSKRLEKYEQMEVDMIVFGPPQGASLKGVQRLVEAKSRF